MAADLLGLARVGRASRCKLGPRRTGSSGLAWRFCLTQQAGTLAFSCFRPHQGALRFTRQAKVATMVGPRPRQGHSLSTSTKRSEKTFRSGTGPGATRPRL
eukprot:4199757-Amphidinium_carterae.1